VKRKDPCFPVSPLSQARQRNADRDGRPPRLIASAPSRLAPSAARPRVRLPPHQGRILHLPAHPHRYGRRPRSLFLDRLGQQALASDSHRLLLWQAVLAGTALRPRPSTPASSPRPGPRCTAAASAAGRASRYSTLVSINQETEHAFPAVCFKRFDPRTQVRCTDKKLCAASGARVVVTDRARTNRADLVLSSPAFAAMARPGMAPQLAKLRTVDVEHKRYKPDRQLVTFVFTMFFRTPLHTPRRKTNVLQGAVRVRAPEPLSAGGGEEPRSQRAGRPLPLPGRPD
jgi:hypothetical protein